ncbi:AraC family transcriptional regulator [Pedobacter ginsengisoli]|uniref:AraC family transcriptional regulator n=1 Tax=Pedobacter ginsengisoli TaxID=363852 RepID=UPI00254A4A0E|nr:helix-turn-helix domain-containing protein [Pedobacter ginsengisoli]
MHVNSFSPSVQLKPFIDNYMFVDIAWQEFHQISPLWRLIPFGQVSALFIYGDKHQYSTIGAKAGMQTTLDTFLVGQLTRPLWLKFSGHTRLAKVQFKTGGIQQFMAAPLADFTDQASIGLENIWSADPQLVNEKLYEAENDSARCKILNSFFEKRLLPVDNQASYVEYTLKQLLHTGGNLKVSDLERPLGISARQVERVFRSRVGISPKDIGKFMRLNTALHALENNPGQQLSLLGYELGYFDPAHFSKDFKQFTGISPSAIRSGSPGEYLVAAGKCFKMSECRIFTKTSAA